MTYSTLSASNAAKSETCSLLRLMIVSRYQIVFCKRPPGNHAFRHGPLRPVARLAEPVIVMGDAFDAGEGNRHTVPFYSLYAFFTRFTVRSFDLIHLHYLIRRDLNTSSGSLGTDSATLLTEGRSSTREKFDPTEKPRHLPCRKVVYRSKLQE
jgi:hypothetical protein